MALRWTTNGPDAVLAGSRGEIGRFCSGRLHCETGPALCGKHWFLRGVEVPRWLVETRAEELDPKRIAEIANAQVRAEFVRKIGAERLCYALKAMVLDAETWTLNTPCGPKPIRYELLRLDLGGGRQWLYLKMENPSTGMWHVEGVPPDTQTVLAAFESGLPAHLRVLPVVEDGAEWGFQGDVVFWPDGATNRRPLPSWVA